MINVIAFSEDSVSFLAYKIEDYIRKHHISKEQIISINYTDYLRTKTALLVYEN